MDHAWFFLWVVLANFLIRPILTLWYVNTKPNAMIASEIFAHSDRSGIEEGTTAMKCPNATGLCPTKMIFPKRLTALWRDLRPAFVSRFKRLLAIRHGSSAKYWWSMNEPENEPSGFPYPKKRSMIYALTIEILCQPSNPTLILDNR